MPTLRDFISTAAGKMPDGPVKAGINRVVSVHQNFELEAAKIADNVDLSPDGKRKAAQAFLTKHAHEAIRARKMADRAKARITEKRAKLPLPAVDRTDAIAAATYQAIWAKVAGMSPAELAANLPKASLTFCQAILAAPVELTGVGQDAREAVLNRALDIAHPGKLAALAADQEAATMLDVAARALADAAKDVAELPNDAALRDFLNNACPDQRHIDADIERITEPLAAA